MKFTYDKHDEQRECVAFEASNGVLFIGEDSGMAVVIDADGDLYRSSSTLESHLDSYSKANSITHRFYRGDKVTIEF